MRFKPYLISLAVLLAVLIVAYGVVLRGPFPIGAGNPSGSASTTAGNGNSNLSSGLIFEKEGVSFEYPSGLSAKSGGEALWTGCEDFEEPQKISGCVSFVKVLNLNTEGPVPDAVYSEALVNDVVLDPSGMHPRSIADFKKVVVGTHEFYSIRTGRFEGILSYNYYLIWGDKVYVFSFTSRGVDWTNPNLDEENDPTHVLLRQILVTVKLNL